MTASLVSATHRIAVAGASGRMGHMLIEAITAADDCVLTPISENVWACKEFKSGKIFMVRR